MSNLFCSLQVRCSLWSPWVQMTRRKEHKSIQFLGKNSRRIKEILFKQIPDGELTSAPPSLGPALLYIREYCRGSLPVLNLFPGDCSQVWHEGDEVAVLGKQEHRGG